MIREATVQDWPHVDRMLRAFSAAGPSWVRYDSGHFAKVFGAVVSEPNGVGLLWEGDKPSGVLIAFAMPSPFSGDLVAQELAWWIDPEARGGAAAGAMLGAYEAWTRRAGVTQAGMTCLDDRTGRLFERRGYERAETVYRVT